jgi:hypothetical protein
MPKSSAQLRVVEEVLTLQAGYIMTLEPVGGGADTDILRFRVGDCDQPDFNAKPRVICANSGVARPFLGQVIGHEAIIQLHGRKRSMRLINIEID